MSCILRISGRNLDIDAFIEKSKLRVYKKCYKGEPVFPKTKPDGEKLRHFSVSAAASNAEFEEFEKQVKDVIRYLKRNKEKLAHIATTKGVEFAFLDFGVRREVKFCQEIYFPPQLVKLAGELGLSLQVSIYPSDEDDE